MNASFTGLMSVAAKITLEGSFFIKTTPIPNYMRERQCVSHWLKWNNARIIITLFFFSFFHFPFCGLRFFVIEGDTL